MKPILFIDMDGVVADFMGYLLKEAKKVISDPKFQSLQYEDIDTYNLEQKIDDPISLRKIEKIYTSPEFFWRLDLIPGSKEAIRILSEHYEIFFCSSPLSSKRNSFLGWTSKITWVNRNFGNGWADRVILTRDKTVVIGDFLIDDNPEISGVKKTPAWQHVVFKQPWNAKKINGRPFIENWLDPEKVLQTLKDLTL